MSFVVTGWLTINDLDPAIFEQNRGLKLLSYLVVLRLTLPLNFKRWHDLGPRLSKFWFALYLLNILIPSYNDFENPGYRAFASALALIALYPGFKLIFFPGNKYYRIQAQKREIIAANIVIEEPYNFRSIGSDSSGQ
jgi:uncharacterized membrane protein YhaH (DUF805 family)